MERVLKCVKLLEVQAIEGEFCLHYPMIGLSVRKFWIIEGSKKAGRGIKLQGSNEENLVGKRLLVRVI